MRLPKLIYEIYPWLYILGGTWAIGYGDMLMAYLSGALLTVSGVAILFLRRNYRSTQHMLHNLHAN